MGFFDSLFGTNTTSAQDAATQSAIANLTQTGQQSAGILRGTTRQAGGILRDQAGLASGAVGAGYDAGLGAVTDYGNKAQGALVAGTDKAVGTVLGSNGAYQPYVGTGADALKLYSDSLGLNGAAGNAAATSAFQTAPGYEFQRDQGVDAAARKMAALGLAGSGNTLRAITDYSSNLANQAYGGWQDRLSGLSSQGLTAANAISSNNQTAGGFQNAAGTTGAGIFQQMGQNLGTLNANKGTALGGIQTWLGNSLSNNLTNLGTNLANSNMGVALQNANLSVGDAKAQDAAANADSGIFSKLLGGLTGLPLGGNSLGSSSPGSFTITPNASASNNGGVLSGLIGKFQI